MGACAAAAFLRVTEKIRAVSTSVRNTCERSVESTSGGTLALPR